MKRVLAGVGALSLVAGVSMALASPSAAGSPQEELEASLTPEVVAPGGDITVSSVDPCPAGSSGPHLWTMVSLEDPEAGFEGPHVPLDEDGHWTVTIQAPGGSYWPDAPLGEYVFDMDCGLPHACDELEIAALTASDKPEVDCTEYYYQAFFTVEEPSTPPTTAPPGTTTPPAATPIVDDPPFTG